MNGCMCGCGGWGYSPRFAEGFGPRFVWYGRRPGREERLEWLEEFQRDLEERAADVADEIKRLKAQQGPA